MTYTHRFTIRDIIYYDGSENYWIFSEVREALDFKHLFMHVILKHNNSLQNNEVVLRPVKIQASLQFLVNICRTSVYKGGHTLQLFNFIKKI